MKNINHLPKNLCCGCASCKNSCPINSISMKENDEGFLYPVINEKRCTKCGLCAQNCPAFNPQYNNSFDPKCYAAMAEDSLRYNSSSGGVFPILAYYFLKNSGYVAGAVWTYDGRVNHIVSSEIEDIERMRGSKYLQSEIAHSYKEVKNLLDSNKKILFTGTPCQIAGLYSFLKKDYKNLYTLDIVCHGTPSPLVFKKYLEQELGEDEEFISTNFRDKVNGWSPKLSTTTTTTTKRKFSYIANDDDFLKCFLLNFCLRNSCNECIYNKIPRQADISIGDFWGIEKYSKKLNDEKGTSLILINNSKGDKLFKEIITEFKVLKEVPLKYAIEGNPVFIEPCSAHNNKKTFYQDLKKHNLKKAITNNLSIKYDGVIFNYWYSPKNYGAVLTAYCLQQYLKSIGKDYKLVNWMPDSLKKSYSGSFCENFSKINLSLTKEFKNISDLKELNALTDNFIVGSDQVFRYQYMRDFSDIYFLKFINFSKKRIAFSASFGTNNFEGDPIETYYIKKALKRFNAVSIREESGVELCKNEFDIISEHIIDPVFLVKRELIEKFVDINKNIYSNKIVTYILDESKRIKKYINLLSKSINKEVISIANKNISMEEWLSAIYNCEYLITDSFHGSCLAIIFHKPFICLKNVMRGVARFDSIQKTFKINKNFIYDINEISIDIFKSNIDWNYIETIIKKEQKKTNEWINSVLHSNNESDIYNELDFLNNITVNHNEKRNLKNESLLEKIFSIRNEISNGKKTKFVKILGKKIKLK